MSEGPIAQERASHKPPRVSTSARTSTHLSSTVTESGTACGRRVAPSAVVSYAATCADCGAADRADRAAAR